MSWIYQRNVMVLPAMCFAVGFGACWLMYKYERNVRKLLGLGQEKDPPKVVKRTLSDMMMNNDDHDPDNDSIGKSSNYESAAQSNGAQQELLLGEKRLKMILIVRMDIEMTAGKICTSCAHCVVGTFKKLYKRKDPNLLPWDREGGAKIAMCVESEKDMIRVSTAAKAAGVATHTVLEGPDRVRTVMALGPAFGDKLSPLVEGLNILA